MSRIEILSPAGSFECVRPAVNTGADAIYLGLENFSARSRAKNFTKRELEICVNYCHARDVKVFLAINTLIKTNEMEKVLEAIKFACSISVDAVIIQDIGLLYLIRKIAPDLPIHASTQMSCHTVSSAEFLKDYGVKRVVLARELSKSKIKEISENCGIETEVFVHGSLCVAFSGQCYLSAMLGTRSANRGLCAGSCRLPFNIAGTDKEYALSLKDNSIIDRIRELEDMGVTSAKIEGRMKRPEYVAVATKACYNYLNYGHISNDLYNKLKSVFSRDGFTSDYYDDNISSNLYGNRKKEDVISADPKTLAEIRQYYRLENQKLLVNFNVNITESLIKIEVSDSKNNICEIEMAREENVGFPFNAEGVAKHLAKTGNTPFYADKIEAKADEGVFIKVSEINEARRRALAELEKKRTKREEIEFKEEVADELLKEKQIQNQPVGKVNIRAWFEDTDIPECFRECELVYVPLFSKEQELSRLINNRYKLSVHIPVVIENEQEIYEKLISCEKLGVKDVWVGTLDALNIAKKTGMKIHAGFRMNVFNSYACDFLEENGVVDAELSIELKASQISAIAKRSKLPTGIIGYGYLPVMLLKSCPVKYTIKGCKNRECTGAEIQDRKKINFKVFCKKNYVEISNSLPLYIGEKVEDFEGVNFIILRYNVENSVEKGENYMLFNSKRCQKSAITRGLYYRGVE